MARALAAGMPRAAHVGGDEVNLMIVSGGVGPVSEPRQEAERQLRLRAHNVCSLAGNFADFGFSPVIDHVVPDRAVLDLMVGLLAPRPVLFVTLAASLQAAARRNGQRSEQEQFDGDFGELRAGMERALASTGWWFDTSDLTVEETVARIRAEAPDRAVVAG